MGSWEQKELSDIRTTPSRSSSPERLQLHITSPSALRRHLRERINRGRRSVARSILAVLTEMIVHCTLNKFCCRLPRNCFTFFLPNRPRAVSATLIDFLYSVKHAHWFTIIHALIMQRQVSIWFPKPSALLHCLNFGRRPSPSQARVAVATTAE